MHRTKHVIHVHTVVTRHSITVRAQSFAFLFRLGNGMLSISGCVSAYKRFLRSQFPRTGSVTIDFCTQITAALYRHL